MGSANRQILETPLWLITFGVGAVQLIADRDCSVRIDQRKSVSPKKRFESAATEQS